MGIEIPELYLLEGVCWLCEVLCALLCERASVVRSVGVCPPGVRQAGTRTPSGEQRACSALQERMIVTPAATFGGRGETHQCNFAIIAYLN